MWNSRPRLCSAKADGLPSLAQIFELSLEHSRGRLCHINYWLKAAVPHKSQPRTAVPHFARDAYFAVVNSGCACGTLKLRHMSSGSNPITIRASWEKSNPSSHGTAASMKP